MKRETNFLFMVFFCIFLINPVNAEKITGDFAGSEAEFHEIGRNILESHIFGLGSLKINPLFLIGAGVVAVILIVFYIIFLKRRECEKYRSKDRI